MKGIRVLFSCSCFVLLFSLSSCYSLVKTALDVAVPALHWSQGTFQDDWGDSTGEYFTQYDGDIDARYSNSSSKNELVTFTELRYSKHEGLTFFVPGHFAPVGSRDVLFNIKLADGSTVEFAGYLNWTKKIRVIVTIPHSEELLNTLLQENILVRFSIPNYLSLCQFEFPKQFKEAHEKLIARENG